MKRIMAIVVLLITIFLVACAAQQETTSVPVTITSNLIFSYDTFTYTDLPSYDILAQLDSPQEDFRLYSKTLSGTDLTESEDEAVSMTITLFSALSAASGEDYQDLLDKTSQELNQLAQENDIMMSILDIVAFNDMKTRIETLNDSGGRSDAIISKVSYIEQRLGRTLTSEEIEALDVLQKYYYYLNRYSIVNPIGSTNSNKAFSEAAVDYSFDPLTTEEEALLDIAYPIIEELLDTESTP